MKGAVLMSVLISGYAGHDQGGRSFSSLQIEAKSLCDVMADPNSYVGQRIMIKGTYFTTPHERLLIDDNCSQWDFRVSHSLLVDSDAGAEAIVERFRKKHPTVNIPVVYSGIFTARAVISGCTKPSCYSYSLEESQLLAASPHRYNPRGK